LAASLAISSSMVHPFIRYSKYLCQARILLQLFNFI
jgi:hypothetical protein